MSKKKFECHNCGTNKVSEWESGVSPSKDKEGNIYCDDCWREYFQFYCPICENDIDKEEGPENTFFYLAEDHGNLKPGYYKVNEFPVFISDMFSAWIRESNVERVSENICYKRSGPLNATDFICRDCFSKLGEEDHRAEAHVLWAVNSKVKNPSKYKWTVAVSEKYYQLLMEKIRQWGKSGLVIKKDMTLPFQKLAISKEKKL